MSASRNPGRRKPCGGGPLTKLIGLMTADFTVFYELVGYLRHRRIPFVPLTMGEEVPANVGVVITSPEEAVQVDYPHVVAYTTPADAVDLARCVLSGKVSFRRIVIGIDPGDRPGVVVLGDGRLVSAVHAERPESVAGVVGRALESLESEQWVVRIGHGAPTHRDRIVRTLIPLGVAIELVDETSSTPPSYRTNAERDIQAAKQIALAEGTPLDGIGEIRPSAGEVRDIQRRSRLASRGLVTISRELAHRVAVGDLTLEEAVSRQQQSLGFESGHALG